MHAAAYASDGTRIVTCSYDTTARVWEASSGQCVGVLRHDQTPTDVLVSCDAAVVVTLAGTEARLWRRGGEVYDEVARLGGVGVAGAALSPDAALVAVCLQDGGVVVYEAAQGKARGVFSADAPCRCCAFGGEGVLAVGTESGQVHFLSCAD